MRFSQNYRDLIVLTLLFISIAQADITVDTSTIQASTEVLFPQDGVTFWVAHKDATIDITARGKTSISYKARASLDLYPYTGASTGGRLTHHIEFIFDGDSLDVWKYQHVPDAPPGELEGPWEKYGAGAESDVLSLTKTCAVGIHSVLLWHTVFDDKLEIHAVDYDWHIFYVRPIPAPSSLLLLCLGGGIISFGKRCSSWK